MTRRYLPLPPSLIARVSHPTETRVPRSRLASPHSEVPTTAAGRVSEEAPAGRRGPVALAGVSQSVGLRRADVTPIHVTAVGNDISEVETASGACEPISSATPHDGVLA